MPNFNDIGGIQSRLIDFFSNPNPFFQHFVFAPYTVSDDWAKKLKRSSYSFPNSQQKKGI